MAPIDSMVSVGCVEVSRFSRDDVVICAERDRHAANVVRAVGVQVEC